MNLKHLYLFFGLVLIGLVGAELTTPGLLPSPFGEDALTALGGVVLLYALFVVIARRRQQIDRIEIPEVERSLPTRVPGDDLRDVLGQFPQTDREYVGWGYSTTVREGLKDATIAVLVRYEGCSEQEAREQLTTKGWTDDAMAADFLAGDLDDSGIIENTLRTRLSVPTNKQRAIDRTIDAIVDIVSTHHATTDESVADSGAESDEETSDMNTDPGEPEAVSIDPSLDETRNQPPPGVPRETHHWAGVSAIALLCLGLGLIVQEPGILLAGIVGIGYVAYARSFPLGTADITVERTVSDTDPDPDDDIEVTLEVTNDGDRLLPDLRVVDGVPATLAVSDGSPRCGTALRPGESATVSYTVQARCGSHEFDPTLVIARNFPGSTEQIHYPATDSAITCMPPLRPTTEPVPLRNEATQYTGVVETDSSGDGLEFHTVREYEPGDAMTRIDWNRRAKTGELTTLELREERAAKVVLAVDVRPSAYIGPTADSEHAVDRSVAAVGRVFSRLLDDGHRVGIATVGPAECWLEPGSGTSHRHHATELLATDPSFSSIPTESTDGSYFWEQRLRRLLPDNTQIILFSPLCDRGTVRTIRRFEAYGFPMTVVSPNPTTDDTPERRLQAVSRSVFLTDLRRAGIPVLDWSLNESLDNVLATGRITKR